MNTLTKYLKCPLNGLALSLVFSFSAAELRAETEETQDSAAVEESTEVATEENKDEKVVAEGETLEGVCPVGGAFSANSPSLIPNIPFATVFEAAPVGYGDKIAKIELVPCPYCAQHKESLKLKFLNGSEISLDVDAPEYRGVPFSKRKSMLPMGIEKSSKQSLPNVELSFEGSPELKAYINKLILKKTLALKIYGCQKNTGKGVSVRGTILEDSSIAKKRFKKESLQGLLEKSIPSQGKVHIEENAALTPEKNND